LANELINGLDNFHTRNQFSGGRVAYTLDWLDVSVLGKVALGSNAERLAINGSTAVLSAVTLPP
jgi:hypothetical protein